MELASIKNLELDKICRVCLAAKKDMRPLFGEMIADMLMECASVQIENTDGWPDKICIQCVHQISRCHAFKTRVERSDKELRNYIKGLTVIVEEPITQIELQSSDLQGNHHHQMHHRSNEISIKQDMSPTRQMQQNEVSRQVVISNHQLHGAQILNTAQIVTTHGGQQMAQLVNAEQIGQLIQTGGTVQMIQQNGQPAQVVQIQQTGDDRCEIIVQPDMPGEAQYFEDVTAVTTQGVQGAGHVDHSDDVIHIHESEELEEDDEEEISDELTFALEMSDDSDNGDKMYMAEFISLQTSCPSPGRYVCNLCRKEFKHGRWLQSHMKSHSNWIKANCKRQPQCEICQRSFKGPGMLKMHMKTHEKSADKIPTCSICNKQFKSRTQLYRHRQTHQTVIRPEKAYQCGNCLRAFASPYTLTSHMNIKHMHELQTFRCVQCTDEFSSVDLLKNHVQTFNHLGASLKDEPA